MGEVSVRWEDQENRSSNGGGTRGPVLGPQEEETGKPGSEASRSPETGDCTAERSRSPEAKGQAEASLAISPVSSAISPLKLGGARGRSGAARVAFALAALLGMLALAAPLIAFGTASLAQPVTLERPAVVEQAAVAPVRERLRRERVVVWLILAARGDTEVGGRGTCWPGLVPGCLSG